MIFVVKSYGSSMEHACIEASLGSDWDFLILFSLSSSLLILILSLLSTFFLLPPPLPQVAAASRLPSSFRCRPASRRPSLPTLVAASLLFVKMDHRLWMYNMHYETGACLKHEFIDGVRDFIEHTMTLDIYKNNGLVRCRCSACRDGLNGLFYNSMHVDEYNMLAPHDQIRVEHDRVHEMINDAFGVQGGMEPEQYFDEAPNEEARRFYDQLEE
ncbi:hypothetical protein H5410_045737 [Solanum commersonii]|uniref:Transposase-associated domain-containing protein n=1 Tax=Solanum commersonii TaxID=4109 RepID=A0A9J5XCI1_SOLCO|nr:hypothetical protein H5410_045737 [Solanum commersonii]